MCKKPKIDPIAVELTNLFIEALQHKPMLTTTAFCIDLARSALGWELAGDVTMARNEITKKIKKECFAQLLKGDKLCIR